MMLSKGSCSDYTGGKSKNMRTKMEKPPKPPCWRDFLANSFTTTTQDNERLKCDNKLSNIVVKTSSDHGKSTKTHSKSNKNKKNNIQVKSVENSESVAKDHQQMQTLNFLNPAVRVKSVITSSHLQSSSCSHSTNLQPSGCLQSTNLLSAACLQSTTLNNVSIEISDENGVTRIDNNSIHVINSKQCLTDGLMELKIRTHNCSSCLPHTRLTKEIRAVDEEISESWLDCNCASISSVKCSSERKISHQRKRPSKKKLHRTQSEGAIPESHLPDLGDLTISLAKTKSNEFGPKRRVNLQDGQNLYLDANAKRCEEWLHDVRAAASMETSHVRILLLASENCKAL